MLGREEVGRILFDYTDPECRRNINIGEATPGRVLRDCLTELDHCSRFPPAAAAVGARPPPTRPQARPCRECKPRPFCCRIHLPKRFANCKAIFGADCKSNQTETFLFAATRPPQVDSQRQPRPETDFGRTGFSQCRPFVHSPLLGTGHAWAGVSHEIRAVPRSSLTGSMRIEPSPIFPC